MKSKPAQKENKVAKIESVNIEEVLVKGHYVTPEDIKKATEFSQSHDVKITDFLLAEGIISNRLLGQALAEYYGVSYADLELKPPTREQILKISERIAKKDEVVLYEEGEGEVTVATSNPANVELLSDLDNIFSGKKVKVFYCQKADVETYFKAYEEPLVMKIIEAIGGGSRVAPEIIKQIFDDALTRHTSDIHFEPQEDEIIVRFRIDGVLHVVGKLPKDTYENILTRIKIQAHLRIDEHFAAQDGAIRFKNQEGEKAVDMRVSMIPTLDGEKVVIRILSGYVQSMSLEDIGLLESHQQALADAAKRPFGMILVTGPTGSGKSTTLYAVLKTLNHPEVNITTIEDPVEYKIPRVNQIQVNPQTDLTFAKGLRSIVRQDPNVILVGEIRDLETAEIAVNATLTGHLLLSTFHANDAATTIPRLLNMGVEPFMLASTLELVVAQRLVRKICQSCKYSYAIKESELPKTIKGLDKYFGKGVNLYRGKGCPVCNNTGYKGRTAIFEMIHMTSEMKELVLTNPSVNQIEALARRQGVISMFEDGVEKVKSGVTTIEELSRVAIPPTEIKEKKK